MNTFKNIKYLHTDSRSVFDPAATLFVALHTGVADGHSFIPELYSRGVRNFVVETGFDTSPYPEAEFHFASDTLEAVREMAASKVTASPNDAHIVVTGSHGKTTAKELIYETLMRLGYPAVRSPRSWNSRIGVPAGLWENISDHCRVIVTEVGIDGPRQAEWYADLLRPTVGVLTSMSKEHDKAFRSHAAKLREKVRLLAKSDCIVYDAHDPALKDIIAREAPGVRAIPARDLPELVDLAVQEVTGRSQSVRELVESLAPVSTRIDVEQAPDDTVLVFDHYTHDDRSLRDALDFLRRRKTPEKRTTLIISDFEHSPAMLDEDIEKAYVQAGEYIRGYGIDRVIAIGPESVRFFEHLKAGEDSRAFAALNDFYENVRPETFASQLVLVKGQKEFDPEGIVRMIQSARHDTTMEVNLDALVHNYNYYRRQLPRGTKLIAMVKASAYGMGSLEVAKSLQSAGAAYLAVAVADEGVALRQAGVSMPIIILNPLTNKFDALFRYNLEPTVFSVGELERLVDEARKSGVKKVEIHVKLDTGMHRLGFTEAQLPELFEALEKIKGVTVKVKSVFSHLATADCLDMDSYTEEQIATFDRMSATIRSTLSYGSRIKRHLLNTAGIERYGKKAPTYEMARLGIGLYGISPLPGNSAASANLRPVARMVSTIISLKEWPEGTPIGYGCRGVTKRPSRIATVPVGYADGVNRHMGRGNSSLVVKGVECPTIGNICMDLCMVDVTDVPDVAVGDSVEIFGPAMPIERVAAVLDTIPYEVLTSVSPRVHRAYLSK